MAEDKGGKTREKFFMALMHELAEAGYERVSVSRVIRRAGLTKGAFYHHFRDKEDLLRKGLEAHMKGTRGYVIGGDVAGHPHPEEMICADIARIRDEFGGTAVLQSFIEFKLMAGRTPDMAALFLPDQEGKLRLLEDIVIVGQRVGRYRKDIDPAAGARGAYEAVFGAYYVALANPPGDPVAAAQAAVRRYFALMRPPN